MTVPHTSRMRARVTRGTALLGAGILISALNISASPPSEESAPTPVVVRDERPSRSHSDRLDVQSGVSVSEDADIDLPAVTASAEPASESGFAGGKGSVCIAAPLEPGTFHISSSFGMRTNPIIGGEGLHAGVDLAAPLATPIHAVADGLVTYTGAGQAGRSPELVIIEHEIDGIPFSSWYIHMYPHGVFVEAGQRVRAGERIAEVGSNGFSTGPHLHLEIHTPIGGPGTSGMTIGALLPMSHEPGPADDQADTTEHGTKLEDSEDGATTDRTPTPEDHIESFSLLASPTHSLSAIMDEGEASSEDAKPDSERSARVLDVEEELEPDGDARSPAPESGSDTTEDQTEPELGDEEGDEVDAGQDEEEDDAPESDTGSSPDERSKDSEEVMADPEESDPEAEGKDESETLNLDGSDIEIPIEDDDGENDHTIDYTVSRTTGFFDLRSLGMVHDPFPFLERFEYGILAPSACFSAGGSSTRD